MNKKDNDSGWVSLHRKIQENWIYPTKANRSFTQFEAWIDLLLNANHCDKEVLLGLDLRMCKRGQQLRSLQTLSKRWNWSKGKVRRSLLLFQKCSMIELKPEQKTTQITICNYDNYQGERNANETPTKRQRPASGTQTIMINNDNNGNNFFPEKNLNDLFHQFLMQRRKSEKKPVDALRIEKLIKQINSMGGNSTHTKIAIIEQAIAGDYRGFRPVPGKQKVNSELPNGPKNYDGKL